MKKKSMTKPAPNISGTFQVSEDTRVNDLNEVEKSAELDEKSMYYARLFMED